MRRWIRFLAPAGLCALAAAITLSAAPVPAAKITLHRHQTEERPARDHLGGSQRARLFDRRHLQRRLARRAQGPHGIRPPLRAHDVQGLGEGRTGRTLHAGLQQRRQHERHDQPGPHALLRDAAVQPARSRRCSSKPIGCGRSRSPRRTSTTSATPCRKSGGSAWTTSRTARRSRSIDELAYENFAYEHSVIGSMDDLNAASVDDVKSFFKTYYAPNNAVLAIVGDVEADECAREGAQVLRAIPSQPAPPPVDLTEPPQTAERRQTLDDPLARLPRIDIVWHMPPALAPDDDALTVLATVLGERPQLAVLREPRAAAAAHVERHASFAGNRGPGLFRVVATAAARQVDRRPRSGDLRRDREGQDRADRRLGNREGAQQLEADMVAEPRQLAAARDLARPVRAVLRRSEPHQHVRRSDRGGDARPTCSASPGSIWSRPTARSSSRMPEGGAAGRRSRGGPVMSRRRLAPIALVAALSVVAAGAVAGARQGAQRSRRRARPSVMKGRAPVSTELLQVKLPRPAEADLPNGLHVMVLEDRRVPAGHVPAPRSRAPAATTIRPTCPASRRSPPR